MYDQPTPPPTPPSTPGGTPKVHAFIPQIRPRTLKKPPTVIRRPTSLNNSANEIPLPTPPSPTPPKLVPTAPKPVIPNFKRKAPEPKPAPATASPQKKQRRDNPPSIPPLDVSEKPKVRTMKQVMYSLGGKPMPRQSTEVIISNVERPRTEAAQAPSGPAYVPQVRIVDGQVVLDESSLVVASIVDDRTVDYNRMQESNTRPTNAYRRKNTATDKWTKKETEQFYNALRQYGTDFTLLELLFPTRSRRQIRNKFKKEEKHHPKKVDEALNNRIPINAKKYKRLLTRAKDKATTETQQQQPPAGAAQPVPTEDGQTAPLAEDGTQEEGAPSEGVAPSVHEELTISKEKITGDGPLGDEDEEEEEEDDDLDSALDREENFDFPLHY